jgi:hypothetical protein
MRAVFLLGLDGFDCEPCESGNWRSMCSQCDSVLPEELSLIADLLLFFAPFVSHFLAGAFTDVVSGYAINRNSSLICNFMSWFANLNCS